MQPPDRPAYLPHIDYLRGIAIVLIVIQHAQIWLGIVWPYADHASGFNAASIALIEALLYGGSAYLIFVSGYMYAHIFHGRRSYGAYLGSRLKRVALPYLFVSAIVIAARLPGDFPIISVFDGGPTNQSLFYDIAFLLISGRTHTSFWFIPVILMLYAMAPFFDGILRLRPLWQGVALAILSLLALVIHRPPAGFDALQALFYFLPVYTFGVLCGAHAARFTAILEHRLTPILSGAVVLALAIIRAFVPSIPVIEEALPFDLSGIDLVFFQHLASIVLLLALLYRIRHIELPWLSRLAALAFGIYFTHPAALIGPLARLPHTGIAILDLAIYGTILIALSWLIVRLLKLILRRWSRYLIGA